MGSRCPRAAAGRHPTNPTSCALDPRSGGAQGCPSARKGDVVLSAPSEPPSVGLEGSRELRIDAVFVKCNVYLDF